MYGMVTPSNGGAPLANATVAWQVTGGSPSESVALSTTLANVNGQPFYIARVPVETRVIPGLPPLTETPGTLALAPATSPATYPDATATGPGPYFYRIEVNQ